MSADAQGCGPSAAQGDPAKRDGGLPAAPAWTWAAGVVIGAAVVGSGWWGHAFLNLDLVIFERMPLPDWLGLGPAVPRAGLLTGSIAIVSQLIPGPFLVSAAVTAAIAIGFAGASRLASGSGVAGQAMAGTLYAVGPFMLTRIGVGHLGLAFAVALLPWALTRLLRPGDDPRRTFLWCLAFGATGYYGASLALIAILTGLVADRFRRLGAVAGAFSVAQLPWLVPGAFVIAAGPEAADAAPFSTNLDGPGGPLGLILGYGFWQADNQIGVSGPLVPLLASGVLALAMLGARDLPQRWGRRSAVLATAGGMIAVASAAPILDGLYEVLSQTALGQPLRESQRVLPLALVWLAPAAAFGARRIGANASAPLLRALPAVAVAGCLLILVSPWLWGLGGRLRPVDVPESWAEAKEIVGTDGTVLALPWHQYFEARAADGRLVYSPLSVLFPGDVLASSDPEFGGKVRETADRREDLVPALLRKLDEGEPIADRLEQIGVHWIVALPDLPEGRLAALDRQPGLTRRLDDDQIDVWEVDGWRSEAVAEDGSPVRLSSAFAPLATVDSSESFVWRRAGAPGWLRGTTPAAVTKSGLLEVPAGAGPAWYWPALLVLLIDVAVLVATILVVRSLVLDRRRSLPVSHE